MFLAPGAQTLAARHADIPEWHHGRERYAIWYVELDDPLAAAHLDAMRARFTGLLHEPDARQYHVTLHVAGFFSARRERDDDFTEAQLLAQREALAGAGLAPFELSLGRVGSFPHALFVGVEDPAGALARVKAALAVPAGEVAPARYHPHITLGLYKGSFPAAEVFARAPRRELAPLAFRVDRLRFGYYDARVLQGPLTTHLEHRLIEPCCI